MAAGTPARKCGDSGSTRNRTSATTIGSSPPIRNRPRQPTAGIAGTAKSPASVPPSGTQTIASVTARGRCWRGTYSAASAAAFGIAPPRPMPARNAARRAWPVTAVSEIRVVATAEQQHRSEERRAAAVAIAGEAGGGAADHHPEVAERDDRRHRARLERPVRHDRGQGEPEQLIVEAVEDDRQRRQQDEQPLIAGPGAGVERAADVDGGSVRHSCASVSRCPCHRATKGAAAPLSRLQWPTTDSACSRVSAARRRPAVFLPLPSGALDAIAGDPTGVLGAAGGERDLIAAQLAVADRLRLPAGHHVPVTI